MPRPKMELWGESTREVGVLLLVFAPLELLLRAGETHWVSVISFATLGFILVVLGIQMESR